MSFNSQTIAQTIPDINSSVFLPAIQREFVWDTDQVEKLFDSITRGYPIGSLMFWKIRGDMADEQVKYKFITHYIDGEVYPSSLSGTHHNEQLDEKFADIDIPNKITMVLDGQQRLTALNIGLNGSLTDRKSGTHKDLEKNWRRKKLYLNVLHNPTSSSDETVSEMFDYSFKKPNPSQTTNNYWYPVENILDADGGFEEKEKVIQDMVNELSVSRDDLPTKTISINIEKLYGAIHDKNYITYYEVDNDSEEEVLDIFIRANQGGTQLSKPDMVLSIATSNWTNSEPEISARDEVRDYISELNKRDVRGSETIDVRIVLKYLLAAIGSSTVFTYKNFNNEEQLERLKQTWLDDKFKNSFDKTLNLVDSFNLTLSNLGTNCLLPVFYYLYNNPNTSIDWTTEKGQKNRKRILYWLCACTITNAFHSNNNYKLGRVNDCIDESDSETFPIKNLVELFKQLNEPLNMEKEMLLENVNNMTHNNQKYKTYLSLLYYPMTANTHRKTEVDHIFPSSTLDETKLVEEKDISMEKAKRISQNSHRIGNLQIINGKTNRSKSNKPIDKWLSSTSESYKKDHFIPRDMDLTFENYMEFVEKREQLMIEHIINKFGK